MILHILNKDIRVLWPYALGLAVTDIASGDSTGNDRSVSVAL